MTAPQSLLKIMINSLSNIISPTIENNSSSISIRRPCSLQKMPHDLGTFWSIKSFIPETWTYVWSYGPKTKSYQFSDIQTNYLERNSLKDTFLYHFLKIIGTFEHLFNHKIVATAQNKCDLLKINFTVTIITYLEFLA